MRKLIVLMLLLGVFFGGNAQEGVEIIKPEVYDSYVMFKKTITRRMDLNEKQNNSFNSKNAELSSILVQAVKEGLLKAYKSDSCINLMTDEEFMEKIQVPDYDAGGDSDDPFAEPDPFAAQATDAPAAFIELSSTFFDKIYIKEDLIFDRNRSRMYYYIRTISLFAPPIPGYEEDGFRAEHAIASFKYEDVVSLFRGPMADRAIWYNPQNQAAHMNFADAFELRLFSAPIVKINNAENVDIRQQYGELIAEDPLNAILIQQQYEMDLMEYESELWEY